MRRHQRTGFTIVELLVVIGIIVVLLAILAPSLSSALYRAELANCAAQMDAMSSAAIQYAYDNKERYPQRSALDLTLGRDEGPVGLVWLVFAGPMGVLQYTTGATSADDRPLLAKYLTIDTFVDPFCEEIDLNGPNTQQDNDDVFASYDLLFGWSYEGEGKMNKLGNRVTWENPDSGAVTKWNLMAIDRDSFTSSRAVTSHPDDAGKLTVELHNPRSTDGFDAWVSQWAGGGSWANNERGPIDRNFAYDDGSVSQINDIEAGLSDSNKPIDDRMTLAPLSHYGDDHLTDYTLLPVTN